MLLCDMQGNKYGLLVNTIKKFPKSPMYGQPEVFSLLANTKFLVTAVDCSNEHKIALRFNTIEFKLYFPLFMVLLCVIVKRV